MSECGNYGRTSLLNIPGKVYNKILIRGVKGIAKDKVSEEQYGFRTGKGCIDQISNMRIIIEKMLPKDRVYGSFMDLDKGI